MMAWTAILTSWTNCSAMTFAACEAMLLMAEGSSRPGWWWWLDESASTTIARSMADGEANLRVPGTWVKSACEVLQDGYDTGNGLASARLAN